MTYIETIIAAQTAKKILDAAEIAAIDTKTDYYVAQALAVYDAAVKAIPINTAPTYMP